MRRGLVRSPMTDSHELDPELLRAVRKAVQNWIARKQTKEQAKRVVAAELERIRRDVKRKPDAP